MYCAFSCIFVVLIILILLRSCLTSAEKRITPNVYDTKSGELRDPQKFNIMFNEINQQVDPFSQFDQLPRMPYLEFDVSTTELNAAERKQLNNDDEREALLNQSVQTARVGGN